MIISCEKCSKKFNLEDNLIPNEGRELQCGICNHKWFFKIHGNKIKLENDLHKKSSVENAIEEDNIDVDVSNDNLEKKTEIKTQDFKNNNRIKINKNNPKIVKNSLVFIISIIAIIVLLDTFKYQLNNYFPGLDSLLNNLYESLKDVSLFFNDLIN
tara:strand:+ start:43 stop:510 length:468 start_codon:yes stop_codon:yes gene_type:complete